MRIGTVCRFKPLHLVHAALLEGVCERAGPTGEAIIGIGSSNRYDLRNPFTYDETAAMVDAVLGPRFDTYQLVPVPDLGHGPRWRAQLKELFGDLDLFVSANDYVRSLLESTWPLAHPLDLIPPPRRAPISGSSVRQALARGEAWEEQVPPAVAELMHARGLADRFRIEFGLPTLASSFFESNLVG